MTLLVQRALVLAGLMGAVLAAGAHESPEHEIERLTALMAKDGKTPRQLFERATEYRAWGKVKLAEDDLNEAIRLDPDFILARLDLSRLQLSAGQVTNALEAVDLALERVSEPAARSPLHMMRAQIRMAQGDYARALAECDLAFGNATAELDWYLTRSRIQCYLDRHEARLRGLRAGCEATGSFVLEMEWIEALLDGGRYEEAMRAIEPQFQRIRWQSSWLIRRARARIGLGGSREARNDLRAAVAEIDGRLDPSRPDLTLLVDRGIAWALLGDKDKACRALEELKRRGAEEGLFWRLEWIMK